jgi:hypothetical protein
MTAPAIHMDDVVWGTPLICEAGLERASSRPTGSFNHSRLAAVPQCWDVAWKVL